MDLSTIVLICGVVIALSGVVVVVNTPMVEYEDLCKGAGEGGGKVVGSKCVYEEMTNYYGSFIAVGGILIMLSSIFFI